jgi:hypothetical protein
MCVHAGSVVGATLAGAAMVPTAPTAAQLIRATNLEAGGTGVPFIPPRFWRRMRTAVGAARAAMLAGVAAMALAMTPALMLGADPAAAVPGAMAPTLCRP